MSCCKMSDRIKSIDSMQILDSRGNPTVRVYIELENGVTAKASVPSGASTGENEALELRDGDKSKYLGKGVLKACENVKKIAKELVGISALEQAKIDQIMIDLDGTGNKSKFGANATLGISMAVARAASIAHNVPLFQYLGGTGVRRIPVPFMNILNGGVHSDNSVDFQEFMAAPIGAPCFSEGLRYISETFHTLKKILNSRKLETSVGDEGGFAPNVGSNEEAIELIIEAIEKAGYVPGKDIAIGLDSAASSFVRDDMSYEMRWSGNGVKTSDQMVELVKHWVEKYPIVLWEDPLSENDWSGFKKLTAQVGDKIEIVGDDLFVTNTKYIARGIKESSANSALIKLNQIGTVTESIDAVRMCRDHGWTCFISHRSGETEDDFLADFAVAMDSGHLKTGSACRGERMAKYNRLLEIERFLGKNANYYWGK